MPSFLTLGAIVRSGLTTFRVWAPESRQVDLVIIARAPALDGPPPDGTHEVSVRPLAKDSDGYWSGTFSDLPAGTRYKYRLDGSRDRTFPDPASRYQPLGVHGPSEVIDPNGFAWRDAAWTPPPLDEVVCYELHVGTFSAEGTFRGAIAHLPAVAALGVTAIELMPVADFPGERNWGYDGVAIFAPARCYGTPDDLRALIDAAHGHGLAVYLDVVYNHLGPDGAYANAFSPYYFTDRHSSPWGKGVNLDGEHSAAVREFFLANALHWVDEYHVDGLRLDATHALIDHGPRHFLAELSAAVRAHGRASVQLVAEDHRNLVTLLQPPDAGGLGLDAVWADDFHHQVRVHTAGDHEGYYADFSGTAEDIARTIQQGWFFTGQYSTYLEHARGTDPSTIAPAQCVICLQNHDQIGNRADGARLAAHVDAATYRALSALLLLAPETPLLFMGQEWASRTPFMYFTDHTPELGQEVTEGRRLEFRSFAAFADAKARAEIPDPQAAATFQGSRLDWSEAARPEHREMTALYTRLIALRRAGAPLRRRGREGCRTYAADDHTIVLEYGDSELTVVVRLEGGGEVAVETARPVDVVLSTEEQAFAPDSAPIDVGTTSPVAIRFVRPGAVVLTHEAAPRSTNAGTVTRS